MPHSSGGGSSGGGFHSGSSSSGPTHRTSSRPFPGAVCYVYYDRKGRAKTLYTNQNPKTAMRIPVGTFLLLGFLALVPAAIIPIAGNHTPTKLPTNYVHTIHIQDNLEVLSKEDKATLQDTFQQFFDLSGICPGLISVSNATWKAHYPSLESYALQTYLSQYSDESHWLIVYAADNNAKSQWAFEGMQGNDTDGILPRRVTDVFNKNMVAGLGDSATSVGSAIDGAFCSIMPTTISTLNPPYGPSAPSGKSVSASPSPPPPSPPLVTRT